ncbi:fungal-specific transcription factor domain-containing protein [Penicillium daleae]|uniref:Fungal-specific transcription factor domain-containing protein n=1 Tax=Penicillium daleae TaxID=63821 RepID=A0AAD6CJK0_9EURO|nr:fungal-specific transcription factor domain-containing protein [Penicillium daleae]KAJ5465321.1 fungal-specific transcription factor domain-containing protein [Penicillium daleae]
MSAGRIEYYGISGRVRKNATTACDRCRQRKVKCDGNEPQCWNCEIHGFECTFRSDADKRKRPRPIVSRIQALEQLLLDNNIPIPSTAPTTGEQSIGLQEYLAPNEPISGLHGQPVSRGSPIMEGEPIIHSIPAPPADLFISEPESHVPCMGDEAAISLIWNVEARAPADVFDCQFPESRTVTATADDQQYLSANRHENEDASSNLHTERDLATENDLDSLVIRVGSLRVAEDGEMRFFGATSNLHLLQQRAFDPLYYHHTIRENTQTILEKAGVGQEVPRELEDHLIKLYLSWEDPATHVVDGQRFLEARNQVLDHPSNVERLPSYYSEVLVNAMCAIGAAFTTRVVPELPMPMAEFFSSRAKALLEVEMDSPRVATVQALVVLSAHEAAFTRDARGWLYSGMAMRLAVDLGLHMNAEIFVTTGVMSRNEADIRRTTYFGVYMLDIYWSYYMGRPPMMNAVNATIQMPQTEDDMNSHRIWQPYTEEREIGIESGPSWRSTDPIWTQCKYTSTRYTPIPVPTNTLILRVMECTEHLVRWFNELPPTLQVDPDDSNEIYLPHIIQLNMQYHEILIFANHPFVTNSAVNALHTRDMDHICRTSASAIAKLLMLYERQWTLVRINIQAVKIVFSATLVHFSVTTALRALEFILLAKEDMKKNETSSQLQSSIFGNHEVERKWYMLEVALEEVKETLNKRRAEIKHVSWMEEWSVLSSSLEGDPFGYII